MNRGDEVDTQAGAEVYFLVQTVVGGRARALQEFKSVFDVIDAVEVEGPYDLIVRARISDERNMDTMLNRISRAPKDVLRILPCTIRGASRGAGNRR